MSAELMKLLAARKAKFNRIKTLKPSPGRNRFRLLPGWRGAADPTFFMDFGQHFIRDAAGEVKAVYVCLDKTFGKDCPVCNAIAHGLAHTHDDLTVQRLGEAKSTARVLFNALHIDGPNPTEPQILELAPSVFDGAKGVGGIRSLFDEWPNLLDPNNGVDIIIEKSGTGRDTRYGVQVAGGSKPVPPEALKKLHNLDDFVKQESEEGMRRALTSVSAISGLLPAPAATSADKPTREFEDVFADYTPPTAPAAAATPATAAPMSAPIPMGSGSVTVAAPAAAPAPAVTAAAPVKTLDDELESLLGELK